MISVVLAGLVVAAAGMTYMVIIGLRLRPEWSVYGYLILWITVPKALRFYYVTGDRDLPQGITVFTILEGFAALTLLVALGRRTERRPLEDDVRGFSLWMVWFVGLAMLSTAISFGWLNPFWTAHMNGLAGFLHSVAPLQNRILPILSALYALILIRACFAFIRTPRQVETILLIFFACGVELGLETIIFSYLRLTGGVFSHTIQGGATGGRFNSLVFTAYDMVGVFSVLGLCAAMFFIIRRGGRFMSTPVAVIGFALCLLPAFRSYQRAVLLAAAAAIALLYWLVAQRHARVVAGVGGLIVVIGIVGAGLGGVVGETLGGTVRPDYFSTDSLQARLGLQYRAADTVQYFFPFGAGAGMTDYAMNYPFSGPRAQTGTALARDIYRSEMDGTRTTNPHNMYLEFTVQYGLAGIVLLLAAARVVFIAWHRRVTYPPPPHLRTAFYTQATGVCMLLGICVHGLFDATDLPAWMYVLPIFMMVRRFVDEPDIVLPDEDVAELESARPAPAR